MCVDVLERQTYFSCYEIGRIILPEKKVLKRFIFVPQCLIYDIKLETNNIHLMTYLTYSSGKNCTKHFILPPSLVNAYLLYYLEPASYQTPYSPSQHSLLLIKHIHKCSTLSRTNQHVYTLHEHGHGLNIIKPTTILTLACICDLCCMLSR